MDTHAESALKVIAYFDALVEHRATLEACVRAAAGLSQCIAGLRDGSSSWAYRFNHRGVPADGAAAPTTSHPVRVGDAVVGEVWLERPEGAAPLDDLVAERMALAAGILWRSSTRPGRSKAALIELLLTGGAALEDPGGVLRLLGLASGRPLDIAAVATDDGHQLVEGLAAVHDLVDRDGADGQRRVICSAILGSVGAVLAQPGLEFGPDGSGGEAVLGDLAHVRVGTARQLDVSRLPEAWQLAQRATRFSGLLGFSSVVDCQELGSLTTLGLLSQTSIVSNADVQAVTRLAGTTRGPAILETLETRLACGSLRDTAAALHLHHSSVSYRLRQASDTLELDLDDPRGRLRAELALILWKLSAR